MPPASIDDIKKTFFVFGSLSENASPDLVAKVKDYGAPLEIREIEGQGSYFFTTPFYADLAENEEMVWIKLGIVHDSNQRYSTKEMLEKGWLSRDGVRVNTFQGSVTLVGFMKEEKRCFVYRNILSPIGVRYWWEAGNLLVANNLRLMSHFLPIAESNEQVEVRHYIYRQVYGTSTYVQSVSNLMGGELLTCERGKINLELKRDFRSYCIPVDQKFVNPDTVAWFFDQLCTVIGYQLDGYERNSATLLSGGVDSSAMQAAINSRPGIDFPFPSYSFLVDTPGFKFEEEYAKEASSLLGTEHTFLSVESEKFPDWLVSSISILGQPVHFDAPPSFYAIAKNIADNRPEIKYLFNGANADVLTGNSRSMELVQGDKYRTWPIWILNLMAVLLKPFSQSKSFGARSAAETLSSIRDVNSLDNVFNDSSTCDWDLVSAYFSSQEIQNAFREHRDLLSHYSSSKFIVEQRQLLSLLLDGMSTPSLESQLGLFCGREMLFPFSDDAILEAVFSFEPIDRYSHDHRVKPIMRMALEAQITSSVTRKPKGSSSVFQQAMVPWMRDGVLKELVQEIDRPGYISQNEFLKALDDPDWFTWNMLTLDLFKKYGLK